MFKKIHFKLTDKTLLFPLIAGVILIVIIFTLAIISFNGPATNTTATTPTPSLAANGATIAVEQVVPDETTSLTAGVSQTFLVYFTNAVSLKSLSFTVSSGDSSGDDPNQSIPVSISQATPYVIQVKTGVPIKEWQQYILTVVDLRSNSILISKTYLGGDLQPTRVQTNNQTLKGFLPYTTTSYTLEYNANQNIYIFHFKYDSNNTESITQQLQDAKSQAIQFIESKGVSINSIVIDFRSS